MCVYYLKGKLVMCNLCFSLVVVMCTTWNQRQRIIIINWAHSCIASALLHTATLPTKTGFFLSFAYSDSFSLRLSSSRSISFYPSLFTVSRELPFRFILLYLRFPFGPREAYEYFVCNKFFHFLSALFLLYHGIRSTTLRLFTRIILCSHLWYHKDMTFKWKMKKRIVSN